jgi:bifunctional enzyme CysN/CysC
MATSDNARSNLARILTCGSVDDGKSTLIGRLLFESKAVFTDHLRALETDSRKHGTQGEQLDLALLLDGLQAEREQGITIDVAYRHFATRKRRFILADAPGHEQYTRNMVTGASTADIAIILVDARKGLLRQTRRHTLIVSLLGVRSVVLAVNKMDLVDWSRDVFDTIADRYREMASGLGIDSVTAIPVSALTGDNIVERSLSMPWYSGSSVLATLEELPIQRDDAESGFHLPVQWINRPNADFRGFSGTVASGTIRVGDPVVVQPSGVTTVVSKVLSPNGSTDSASAGETVTLVLADEVDVVRGDMISGASTPAESADVFQATVVWMHDEPLLPGRTYLVKLNTRTVTATFHRIKYLIDPETLEHVPADSMKMNDIGVCTFSTVRPLNFEPYKRNRTMGGFIVIDRHSNATLGAGMIEHSMRRSENIQWQDVDVDKEARSALAGHKPCIIWLTGLSGSGKSTIANALEKRLFASGVRTYLLDGDNLRHGLNHDLGFTPADRVENIRRAGEVARLMVDAGLVVICAFISPYEAERDMVRSIVGRDEFLEIFVDTPLDVLEARDPKGLYAKARAGKITNFTGIDAPYEAPTNPDVRIDTPSTPVDVAVKSIVDVLTSREIIAS